MAEFKTRFGDPPRLLYWIARLYARVFGWKVVGEVPPDPKMIGIIAPHTSNWDVFMMYVMAYNMRIRANWLVKDSVFKGPLAWFFRKMGGIPVDRSKAHNLVDQVADIIRGNEHIYLAIAPEGTRRKTDHWRTGFYWIAQKAGIRFICMYIDYEKKETGFGPIIDPSGDIHADFEIIKEFYSRVTPKHPELRSEMVIRSAEGGGAGSASAPAAAARDGGG